MISVLLATYNGERFIEQSIISVLNQTFTKFELLIGFNGTTDRSKEIVASFNDPRIKVFDYGDDKGKAKTLNKLLQEAKYEWIAIQDDDDVWADNKLETQVQHIKEYDVIGTQIHYINEHNYIIGAPDLSTKPAEIVERSLNGNNQVASTGAIFKKADAQSIDGWKEGLDGVEDFDFWLRLMRIGKSFYNTSEPYVYHRLHSKSNFNSNTKGFGVEKIL